MKKRIELPCCDDKNLLLWNSDIKRRKKKAMDLKKHFRTQNKCQKI